MQPWKISHGVSIIPLKTFILCLANIVPKYRFTYSLNKVYMRRSDKYLMP